MKTIFEYLLSKSASKDDLKKIGNRFPEKMPNNVKHTDDPENIWELLIYLDDNNYEFTCDTGRFDDSKDVIINTKYNGVTVILSFIGLSEYLIEMEKDNEIIYSINSSRDLGWGHHFDFDLLDPLKYFNICLKNMEKKLASAQKGKRNRRTGEIEKSWSDINYYEGKVARYKKYIEAIK